MDIAKNKPFRSLVDARDIFGSMDSEAKEYVVHHKGINRLTIAQAIVANNIATRLVVSIYIGFNKSSHPIRMFSDIDEARAWLLKQFQSHKHVYYLNIMFIWFTLFCYNKRIW